MRVGIDGRSLLGVHQRGIGRITHSMLAALAQRHPEDDWQVLVAGDEPITPPPGVRVLRVPGAQRLLYGASAVLRRPRLDELLDAVDVFWAPAPAPLALSPDVPLVLTVHDLSWELRPADFTRYERLWHRLARPQQLARRAARIAADASDSRALAIDRWNLDPEKVTVVPGIVRTPAPVSIEVSRAVRARMGLTEPYLLAVGVLEPRKAPDVLLAAFVRARAEGLRAQLAIAGHGRLPAAPTPGVWPPDGVEMVGRVDDAELDALYAGARALVMPSRLEGYGLPPLEAALLGTPSILTDLPSFRETLADAALWVAVDDVDGLARAMLALGDDEALAEALAAAALPAARRLTLPDAADLMHALLRAGADER